MRHIFLSLFFSFFFSFCIAQNLVQNPSFEEYDVCPTGHNLIGEQPNTCNEYREMYGYFNACNTNIYSQANVPYAAQGTYQYAASGNAFVGLYSYYPQGYIKEAIVGCQLNSALNIGTRYYVSFKANLAAIDSTLWYNTATDKLGVLFSVNPYSKDNPIPRNNFAHVYTNTIITDTLNWVRITGSFIADSAYQYICLGNFFDYAHTNTLFYYTCFNPTCSCEDISCNCPPTHETCYYAAFYYIDDICVSSDSLMCADYVWTSIEEANKAQFKIFPNPSSGKIFIDIPAFYGNHKPTTIEITDIYGREIRHIEITTNENEMYLEQSGIYFITVTNGTNRTTKKAIISNNN
jgi:hypothetical protein